MTQEDIDTIRDKADQGTLRIYVYAKNTPMAISLTIANEDTPATVERRLATYVAKLAAALRQ